MGIETALIIGLAVATSAVEISNANKQAKAVVRQGAIDAGNKAKSVARKTAAAKVSFINSGFTLEGTPEISIGGVFDVGLQDISQVVENANTTSKNLLSAARTKAIVNIATAAISGYAGADGFGGASGFGKVGKTVGGTGIPEGGFGGLFQSTGGIPEGGFGFIGPQLPGGV